MTATCVGAFPVYSYWVGRGIPYPNFHLLQIQKAVFRGSTAEAAVQARCCDHERRSAHVRFGQKRKRKQEKKTRQLPVWFWKPETSQQRPLPPPSPLPVRLIVASLLLTRPNLKSGRINTAAAMTIPRAATTDTSTLTAVMGTPK